MAEDIVAKLKELRNLLPEERIKRLKEIEEKNRKEIEEAHKLMQESEVEIVEDQKEKEQIPIPQLKVADIDMLVGEEEKRIFATTRFVDTKKKVSEDSTETSAIKAENLEEELFGHSHPQGTNPRHIEEHWQYTARLAEMPTRDVYNAASNLAQVIRSTIDDRGYLSEMQRQAFETRAQGIEYDLRQKELMYKGNERTEELIRKAASTLTDVTRQYIRG